MKKKVLFAAMALVALASCTSDEMVSVSSPPETTTNTETSHAIVFSSLSKGITRADHYGADAADMLNKKFIVGGYKGTGTTDMTVVFDNYNVNWAANTAATTESNTSDWEYVGYYAEAPSGIASHKQTIKFWDYSTTQYDFAAYSLGTNTSITTGSPAAGEIKVSAIQPLVDGSNYKGLTYTLEGARDDLADCYISDMVTVYNKNRVSLTPAQPNYQDEVVLKFRNLSSKVRMALYETVPGYSVKDVFFYQDDNANDGDLSNITNTTAYLFTTGSSTKDNFYKKGTYTVTFPTVGSGKISNSDYNKAHVAFTATGKQPNRQFGKLNYGAAEQDEAPGSFYLGRTPQDASFTGSAAKNYYFTVLPNEEGTVLELRINYTLVSLDGSGEEIKVYGAKAFVPAIYAAWKPNYAYTYIFKISDNTNGWTSTFETDPAGLYPITFAAVVVDSEEYEQSTITNVATPSITTYQKGHAYDDTDTYLASKGNIYIQVMKDGTLATDLKVDGKSKLYTVTGKDNPSEADVMDALNIQKSSEGTSITGFNNLVLSGFTIYNDVETIPGVDGNDITVASGSAAYFEPSAATYAYVYLVSTGTPKTVYLPETLQTRPSDWEQSNLWYTDPDGTAEATTFTPGAVYYKKRYTNNNNVYGVKIIKVQ